MKVVDAKVAGAIREKLDRQSADGDEFQQRIADAIATLPVDALRELARELIDELGYLGEHMPQWRESVAPLACSGKTYHYCSFSGEHDPGCPAAGGDGKLQGRFERATPCASDCGETDARPWCSNAGFDCETCAMVDRLLDLLEAHA